MALTAVRSEVAFVYVIAVVAIDTLVLLLTVILFGLHRFVVATVAMQAFMGVFKRKIGIVMIELPD